MSPDLLERKFRDAGVRLRLAMGLDWFAIAVGRGRGGEFVALAPGDAEVEVVAVDRARAQLVLLVRTVDGVGRRAKRWFLCGRDEGSLFVAGVPRPAGVALNSVAAAHEALKPEILRRRGREFVRQGDWFFLPRPDLPLDLGGARRRVRLGRWRGNPHVVDHLLGDERQFSPWFFRAGRGTVLARGFVRHRQHRPLHLRCWHEVLPNAAVGAVAGGD